MKKIVSLLFIGIVISCSSTKTKTTDKPLYEILTSQHDGGANIRFNEILTEEKEIKMLQGDENLRKKVKPGDTNTSNFVILNMGEKTTANYSINLKSVTETADKIIIKIEDPGSTINAEAEQYFYPYTILKINSKKPIVIE